MKLMLRCTSRKEFVTPEGMVLYQVSFSTVAPPEGVKPVAAMDIMLESPEKQHFKVLNTYEVNISASGILTVPVGTKIHSGPGAA